MPVQGTADAPVVSLRPARRMWRTKYALEWLLALLGTIVVSPLLALCAVLVKLTSRGPVLYRSQRLGKDGRTFTLYKFRSMYVDSRPVLAADGKVITTDNDPRITPVGLILRLGFDELPQLLNILKGDMCLIGPRPDVPWELDRYTPRQRLRLAVLPGISGLTQVMGGRELNNAQNYELDVRYVTRSSFWLDAATFLLTLPYALGAKKLGRRLLPSYVTGLDALADAPGPGG
jgi:lipopolysaccharide/colanic/teichoic acid biosynthesis glycosyltransferase